MGMFFANPWGLLGLLALPAIMIIHLYHRRFPPRVVAGLHLWGAESRVPVAGRKRERLPLSRSLIFELLAALLLTLVLTQPRFGDLDAVRHFIAVIDGSASMSAVGSDGLSASGRALSDLKARLDAAPRGSRVTIISTGRRPVLLAGPAVDWGTAVDGVGGWQPTATEHDVFPALDMASQLAEGGGEVLYYSDRLPGDELPVPDQVRVIAVGESLGNLAITAARWTIHPPAADAPVTDANFGTVFLRIANTGARPVTAKVIGRAGERDVITATVELAAGAERSLQTEVPGGLKTIHISVTGNPDTGNPGTGNPDALAIDSNAVLIEPSVRTVRVANVLPADHAGRDLVQRVLLALPNVELTAADKAALLVAPASQLPESRRDLWWLGIGPMDRSEAAVKDAKDVLGPFLIERRNPLLEGVTLGGVVAAGVQPVPVTPLITAGSQMLFGQIIGSQTTGFILNMNLARSNLASSPDWPILLSNLIEQRRDALPGLRRWNYRINEDIQFRLFESLSDQDLAEGMLHLEHDGRTRPCAGAVRGQLLRRGRVRSETAASRHHRAPHAGRDR